MSVSAPDHGRDSALLRTSDSDWAYKKQLNQLAEISKRLAFGSSRMQDHVGVMQQYTEKLFVKLGADDCPVSPDVRVALLKALIVIWNNFVSTHTEFCGTLQTTLAGCRRSVLAAQKTLTTLNPALASQLPELATLAHDLHVGRSVKVLPAPAPFVLPAGAVQDAAGSAPRPLHRPVTEGSSRSEVKPTGAPLVKSAGAPSVKPASAPPVKSAGAPLVKSAGAPSVEPTGAPLVKSAGAPSVKPAGAPSVKPTGAPLVKSAGASLVKSASPAIKATGATAKHARTPTSGIQVADDATKRPGLVVASQPLAGTTRKAERAASPAPAISHKRQKTAARAGDADLKSDAIGPQPRAKIKAWQDTFEEALRRVREEVANLRRQI